MSGLDASLWMIMMQEEVEALDQNKTWKIFEVPKVIKPLVRKKALTSMMR